MKNRKTRVCISNADKLEARKMIRKGVSQQEIADLYNVSPGAVSRWKKGEGVVLPNEEPTIKARRKKKVIAKARTASVLWGLFKFEY